MKRDTTIFVLCGLMLLADFLAACETISGFRVEPIGISSAAIIGELVFAAGVILLFATVLRKRYRRQKRPANRWRLEVVQP